MLTFVLSDESVNRYGFRVLTSGIRLENFKKNPVMFYNHDRSHMPIGKWTNIKVKDGKLVADPEFDTADELAMKVKDKVEKGIINSTSIGFDVIALSNDPALMLPGQRRSTVTEAELFEASLVDIPGNAHAVRMRGVQLRGDALKQNLNLIIPEINPAVHMEKILAELGLKPDATQDDAVAAIRKIKSDAEVLSKKDEKAVSLLVKMGEAKGLKREVVDRLAKADFDATLEMVESTLASAAPAQEAQSSVNHERLSAALAEAQKQAPAAKALAADDRKNWTLSQWEKQDPQGLLQLAKTEPNKYAELFKAATGIFLSENDIKELKTL